MFKALLKKRKGNKGFTLIELIVVIAIIAILALILVPRFAGFTERAKVAADDATKKTLETGVSALLADGSLKVSATSSFKVTDGTSVSAVSATIDPSDPATIQKELKEVVGDVKRQHGTVADGFVVSITTAGAITITP